MDEFFNNRGNNDEMPNGEYHYVPPKQNQNNGGYYAPPSQNQGYANYYYTPPQNQQPNQPPVVNGVPVDARPKKKKNKALIAIVAIIVVCGLVGIGGLTAAYKLYDTGKPNSSQSGKVDENEGENTSQNDDASASVVGSNEADKTDKDGNLTAAGVAQKAMDSCVGITVYTEQSAYNYFYGYGSGQQNNEQVKSGEGSGVIMSEANGKTYIITCAHVISDSSSCKVTLNNGKEYDAEVIGLDSQTDIGVLSVKATGLKIATFGDSKDIEVGEPCVAIGCPAGLQFMNSVTQGIVSALDRPVSSSIGYSQTCIQVDAAINPGNSGGALFNMQGQVIGINSSKIASTEYEGMGFAIPSNTAIEIANSLIKNGYVAGRAKLGIQYVSLQNYNNASAILSALDRQGYKDASGTMVIQEVSNDSSLVGKVQQYDMIVAVDGEVLTSTDVMTSYLSSHKPNETCTLTIASVENNSIKIREVKCKLIESKE